MPLTIEAIYENGVLKPTEPLPFKEHEKVTVTVQPIISLALLGQVSSSGSLFSTSKNSERRGGSVH
jgi:predicted DNA-binding antitoxin AbrB/MazE fold protein